MTYNTEKILSALEYTMLNMDDDFHEGKNDEFIDSLGSRLFDGNYDYAYGASKLAIIPVKEDIDYVIKIPYTGSFYSESGYYSGSRQQYYHRGYEDYSPFEAGTYEERPWDYCAIEVQRYMSASLEGFGNCLARTEFLGFVRDYPIYIQEKCQTLRSSCFKHEHSDEERSYTKSLCRWSRIPCDWLTDFRLYFGERTLKHFLCFLEGHYWDDDLRDENIGYCNGRPVLIDYSSFLE